MFIIRAERLFHPIVRHHAYQATNDYFHTFCPSLSYSLHPLPRRQEADQKPRSFVIEEGVKRYRRDKSLVSWSWHIRPITFKFPDVSRWSSDWFPLPDYDYAPVADPGSSLVRPVSNDIFDAMETKIWARCAMDNYDPSSSTPPSGTS